MLAFFIVLFGAAGSAPAQDWPQWRGPARNGIAAGVKLPRTLPAELKQRWQIDAGLGHSSPLVVGNVVYIFARQGEDEVVLASRLSDGREIWRQLYAAPYQVNPAAIDHGPGPKATPVVAGGRIYTFGISGVLSSWNAKTGRKIWQKEFGKQFEFTSPLYGVASSPLIDGGRCIAYVGGHDHGALVALDARTGLPRWSWDGDGPAYTSPIVAELSGARQVITQSQTASIGVDAETGELLWKIPFHTDYDQNSVTPVVFGESVIFSGLALGVTRYRVEKQNGKWRTEKIWENKEVSMYMSSPVLSGERLYGFSHRQKGQLFALDVTTGKTLWTSDGRLGENMALIRTGGVIWGLSTTSELFAFADTPKKFDVLARYQVADTPTWAHPVILTGGVLVKDESKLTYWEFPKVSAEARLPQPPKKGG